MGEKSKPKEEKIVFRKSRKAYMVEYACGLILLLLLFSIHLHGIMLKPKVAYFFLGISLLPLAFAEISRMLSKYQITMDKLTITEGLIKQAKKKIYFHPLGFIPDINIHQGRIQRLLDYGTIFVKCAQGNAFEVKDVNQPHEIMKIIERRVEENKHPERKKK